ncbi:MAG: hypothetical protein ACYDGR_07775 [Candidatus Dormibacteria bacterium]
MIARLAYFENLTAEQRDASRDNWDRRFKAALTSQPGLYAAYHVEAPDGTGIAISIWESQEAATDGGRNANAVPLLPGQVGEKIPSPTRTEFCQLVDYWVSDKSRGPA